MATTPPVTAPAAIPARRFIAGVRLITTLVLLALLVVCLVSSWLTRDAMAHLPFLRRAGQPDSPAAAQTTIVDLRPWQTAQALAPLAVTSEEAEYARNAERLADHEVDQAFASALRQANAQQQALTGDALRLSQKVAQLQAVVKQDQATVTGLTASAAHAPSLPENLDVAKAQLGLDSDELADAQQDLARAAGGERARIQQELAAHETVMRKYDAQLHNDTPNAVASAQRFGTLAGRLDAWFGQRSRYALLQQAMAQSQADAKALTTRHDALERQANSGSSQSHDVAGQLASLAHRSAQRQLLSIYDDRIQSEQQLAAVYSRWSGQVLLQHRIILHLLLQSFALVAFILLCVILLDALVRHLVGRPSLDRRRMQTLRVLFKLGIQFIGACLILVVLFGAPRQMPTILGLTTAGLTVVLQDFIIAFFGWFVLMGKNGIRVGDWVEINGVGGEVVDIGLFRTSVLETGNWTDLGHPTGRRVTFINSFAIKGQYFNFSTTGQWMWDEITVSIPVGEGTYEVIDLISKAVLAETEKNAHAAEQEWRRAARKNGLTHFTATPAVDMRPTALGIDIIVRYVTRASDRFEVRNRLYQTIIGLLHKPLTLRHDPDHSPQG